LIVLSLAAGCAGMGGQTPPSAAAAVATIPVGAPPTLLAVAPDGQRVYAASNGSLTVIDTTANAAVATVPINPNSTGIAVAPDGSRVYVTSLFSIQLTVLDTASNTLAAPVELFLQRLRGGFSWLALSPDGATAYIANPTNRALAIVSLPSGQGNILMPTVSPSDVAIAPGGGAVYLAGCQPICTPGFVERLDTANERFTQQIEIGGNPYRIKVAPKGRAPTPPT
jgi:YVTN family beta-propeller protein